MMRRLCVSAALSIVLAICAEPSIEAQSHSARPKRAPTPTNINTANVLELTHLPGIGVKRAQAIVDWREENGPFKTKQALMDIPGIGRKTFEKLEPLISVRDQHEVYR